MKALFLLRVLTLSIFCSIISHITIAQGMIDGFMKGKGRTDVAITYSYEWYDKYYVRNQETFNPNLGTISTQSISFFAAAGLTDFLDVIVALPYIEASPSAGYFQPQSGWQDVSLYFRVQTFQADLGQGKIAAMVAGGISTPVSDYVVDFPIAIGHGSTNLDGRIVAQYKADIGLFASAQYGYIRRNNVAIDRGYEVSVPDVQVYTARAGFAASQFYIDTWIYSEQASSGTNIGPGVPFPSNAISFVRVGVNLYVPLPRIKGIGITASTGFTLSGENIGKATRISGGLVYSLPQWSGINY